MIMLDTEYFKAVMNDKNRHHKKALKIKEYLKNKKETTVINTTILVETLKYCVGKDLSIKELYDDLTKENEYIKLTNEDYQKTLKINYLYENAIDYSDCTIINTMHDMEITKIVSFNSCFKEIDGLEVIDNI